MNAPSILLALMACLNTNLAIATTQPPVDPKATTSSEATVTSPETKTDNDPLSIIDISDEEKTYIEEECKRFSVDDDVTADDLPDYLTLCNQELTIAVKTALLQRLLKKERQAETIKSSKNSGNKPKPM